MPKGQKQAWKNFWQKHKNQRNKDKVKGTQQKAAKMMMRSPFQCSICLNPRWNRKRCYLCQEQESVVQADWLLAQQIIADTKERRNNTLTQMVSQDQSQ